MKKISTLVLAVATVSIALVSCNETSTEPQFTGAPTNLVDSVSYALGINIGENLQKSGFEDLNSAALAKALDDSKAGTASMTMEEAAAILDAYMMKQSEAQSQGAKTEGTQFLAANAGKEGVVTTASGLQYEVLTEGTGASPVATDMVTVHYHGTLIDGTVFDSSVDRGEPAQFPLNGVIAGWTEGLQLMKEGGKTRFFIPSDLAYGDQGAGQMIGPGSTLIFDVELISIGQ